MDLNKLKELIDSTIQSIGGDVKVRFYSEDDTFREIQSIGMAGHDVVLSNLDSGVLFERLFIQEATSEELEENINQFLRETSKDDN